MMKNKYLSIIAAAAAVLVAAACNKPAEEENLIGKMTIAIQPEELVIGEEGGPLSFSFTAPDYWFASSPEKWLTIEPYSGKPGSSTVTFTVSKNTVAQARSAVITVNAKGQKGQIKLTQSGWPYNDEWSISGTVGGGKEIKMEDKGDRLIWAVEALPFHVGETFRFRMGGSDAVSMGIDGGFSPLDGGGENACWANLSQGGENISLPTDGYWDIILNLNEWTISAVLVERFPWTLIGTVNGSNWDTDFEMQDKGERLLWEMAGLPYHEGEEFKFRMDGNDAFSLGLDGALVGADNVYEARLKQGGDNISLPAEGYWTLSLDVKQQTLKAELTKEFSRIHQGVIWENEDPEGNGAVSWSSQYRFGLDGHDGNSECITTFPEEVWNKFKTGPFYLVIEGANPNVRVTTGWWDPNWNGGDIQPGNERMTDNGDGTWTVKLDLSGDAAFIDALDQRHLLFTGDGYTPLGIYPEAAWENSDPEGNGAVSWSSQYRFGLEEHDGNNECIATFPETVWNKMKTQTFFVKVSGDSPQIRVTNGWWDASWKVGDVQPGNDLLVDNGDGTFMLIVNLADDPDFVATLDEKHLLFTGSGYTPLGIYFEETVPIVGDGDIPTEVNIWENDGSHGNINWSSEYRFAPENNATGEEIYAIPMEQWERIKSGTFYAQFDSASAQIRITTGWWSTTWTGNDIFVGNELVTENEDGTYTLEVNLTGDPILDLLDAQHLLFSGAGYTLLRLFLVE